jgi:ATP-dependent DNA ligase
MVLFLRHVRAFQNLRQSVTPKCRLVNPTRRARWGKVLTPGKMKKCVLVRPELVAQVEFLEGTDEEHLRHLKSAGLRDVNDARSVVEEQLAEDSTER